MDIQTNKINWTTIAIIIIITIVFTVLIYYFTYKKSDDIIEPLSNTVVDNSSTTTNLNNEYINYIQNIQPTDTPKIVWTYWENKDGRTRPPTHIQLCFDTFTKHLSDKYKIIILNQDTVKQYLPKVRDDLDGLLIAQKVDYYRIALLYNYGGIWVDADTIIMRDFDEIFEKLDSAYDFVGFGCTQNICFDGKNQPSNGVLASRQHSLLMKVCLEKLDKILDERLATNQPIEYFDLGKLVIWDALNVLKPYGYDYYHFPSAYDGSRDSDGHWIDTSRHFSLEPTTLIDENKLFFVFLTNSGINDTQPWVKDAERDDLLQGQYWISSLFRKSLQIN